MTRDTVSLKDLHPTGLNKKRVPVLRAYLPFLDSCL
jgi:hypothetical protein